MNLPYATFGQLPAQQGLGSQFDLGGQAVNNGFENPAMAFLPPADDMWSGQSFANMFQPMDLCRMLQSWLQSFSQFQQPDPATMPQFPNNPNQGPGEFPTYGPTFPKANPAGLPASQSKSAAPTGKGSYIKANLLRQGNGSSCGQTSVAMAVNTLTGKNWSDSTVNANFGYDLIGALNSGTAKQGLVWRDRDFSKKSWGLIEDRLKRGRPVVMGLNGPMFSPSGRGHIITLLGTKGDKVIFADPATGKRRVCTKADIENAPNHPDGKFFFYASKERAAA